VISRVSIVTIAGDAGGAAALAPVLLRLQHEQTVTLNNFAYFQAPSVLAQSGVPCRVLGSRDVGRSRQLLEDARASLLLTATSVNTLELEKRFVMAARQAGCPSVGVLDFWSNYAARFADGDGGLSCAPDVLAVMDERAQSALSDAGVASELTITGQPAFDLLSERRQNFSEADRVAVRQALGVQPADFLILFVSQALDDLYGDAKARLGFDQHDVRRLVIDTLASTRPARPLILAIRKHPREAGIPSDEHHHALTIVHDGTLDRWSSTMAADLVVGMNSVLLLEASYLGAPVLSLQPGLRVEDALPSNLSGGSAAAYQTGEAVRLLVDYVTDGDLRRRLRERAIAFAPDGRATERVCECVLQQLSRASNRSRE